MKTKEQVARYLRKDPLDRLELQVERWYKSSKCPRGSFPMDAVVAGWVESRLEMIKFDAEEMGEELPRTEDVVATVFDMFVDEMQDWAAQMAERFIAEYESGG